MTDLSVSLCPANDEVRKGKRIVIAARPNRVYVQTTPAGCPIMTTNIEHLQRMAKGLLEAAAWLHYLDHEGDRGVYDHGCPGEVCTAKQGLVADRPKVWPKAHFTGTIGDTSTWPWRERFRLWLIYEAGLTKRWAPKVSLWWHYNVQHYPKPPPLHLDPVYLRLFGEEQDETRSE